MFGDDSNRFCVIQFGRKKKQKYIQNRSAWSVSPAIPISINRKQKKNANPILRIVQKINIKIKNTLAT